MKIYRTVHGYTRNGHIVRHFSYRVYNKKVIAGYLAIVSIIILHLVVWYG